MKLVGKRADDRTAAICLHFYPQDLVRQGLLRIVVEQERKTRRNLIETIDGFRGNRDHRGEKLEPGGAWSHVHPRAAKKRER